MSYQPDHFSSFSSAQSIPPLSVIVFATILLHIALLILGSYWEPSHIEPKKKAKVIVQTVGLKPFQAKSAQVTNETLNALAIPAQAPPLPFVQDKPIFEAKVPQLIKEEALVAQLEPETKSLEPPPNQEVAAQSPPLPVPTPAMDPSPPTIAPTPVKTQITPPPKQTPTPTIKPTPKETPKKTIQPVAPVKKPIEATKPAAKPKPDAAKQKEEAEKKKQQEAAEKKRLLEKAEAEKKRQLEIAELEKKRQQEIALAQEAAKQKVAKAKESLAKMNQTRDKISNSSSINLETAAIPKELASLHIDALPLGATDGTGQWGTKEASYSDEVAYYLKRNLKLPDYGAVKIKLTLDRMGKVKKIEVVKSESEKNKAYLENEIKKIIFSPFGQKFQGVSDTTFVITLQND